MENRITLIKLRKPSLKNVNTDLQWFSESLGLFGERDKEKSCFRVFMELIKAIRMRRLLTSDNIAMKSNLTRATVIHHLRKLQESGLVVHENGKYILRNDNLEDLINEIKRDVFTLLQDMHDIAEELDDELGLNKRKKTSRVVE